MKHAISIFIFFGVLNIQAQDHELEQSFTDIALKIQQTQNAERLQWMDSLTVLVEFNTEYKYDSLVQKTIDFALELDSLNIATRNTSQYIFYKNKVLGEPNDGIVVFNEFMGKETTLNNDKTKSNFYFEGANAYFTLNDLENSLTNYLKSKELAQKGNSELLGTLSLMIGAIYLETGESGLASQELQKANKIFRAQNDTLGIINTKNNISILYSQHQFYEEAEKERNEAIDLIKAYNGPTILSLLYFNAAADYRMMGDQTNRVKNIKLAMDNNHSEHKDFFEPFFLCELIIALAENDSLQQAEHYFNKIEDNLDIYKEGRNMESYIETLKQLELARGHYSQSLDYGQQHLDLKKQGKVYVEIMNAEKFLSDVYKKVKDKENSERHLINYYKIKDSITNVQNAKNLSLYQTLYETEKRDYQIDAQKKDIALLNSQHKVKNQWLLFGGMGLLSIFGFVFVIRSRNMARREQVLQENFSQDLISAQENERNRVSKDLHDSVGQQLTFIKKKAHNLNQPELSLLANSALEEVRSISRDLYPVTLKQLGLKESIEQLLFGLDEESDMFFSVEIDDIDNDFNEKETLNLYRFIQESVSNVLKHSKAKTLIVNVVRHKNEVEIFIKDNGQGFKINKADKQNSLGLKTMAERIRILKGTFSIKSEKELGTSIVVKIPV